METPPEQLMSFKGKKPAQASTSTSSSKQVFKKSLSKRQSNSSAYPASFASHAAPTSSKPAKTAKLVKGPAKTFGSKLQLTKESSDNESSEPSDSEVEVKFELFNMAEPDYHSIKQYLGNLFGSGEHGVDLVGLTAFIVEALADHLGTCIKTDGETSDPFGFLTGFPIEFASKKSCSDSLKTIETFLKGKCENFNVEEFFSESKNVILFQERLINVPGSVAAPLYRQFLDDWNMATSEEPQNFPSPKQVLIISPTYREVVSKLDHELGLQENPANFGVASTETNFYYEEAEYFKDFASEYFDFSVNTGHETSDSRRAFSDTGIEPGRRVFILSWKNFIKFVDHLQEL